VTKETIITALDIGASKVCCLIGTASKNNIIDVLGYGITHHDCLRHGIPVDIRGLSEAISTAVYEAEDSSAKKVQSVFVNISGPHIKGISSRGEVIISDRDNEITKRDVERVITNAKSIHMPYERDIIHLVEKGFSVDGEKGIVNPAGMFGLKLETDIYLITAKMSIIDNLKKAVRQAGIGIEDYVISGFATASCVLSEHEKDLGVILLDIGADVTEILVYLHGNLVHLSSLSLGGDNITKAISDRLVIPEGSAERLKIEDGTLEDPPTGDKITIVVDSRKKTISRKTLTDIIYAEYENVLNTIRDDLLNSPYALEASNGIVICGQPVMMDGVLEMAEAILNFPIKIGHVMGLGTSSTPLPSHIYATAIGLLKKGAGKRRSKTTILSLGPKNVVLALVERARNLYEDYF